MAKAVRTAANTKFGVAMQTCLVGSADQIAYVQDGTMGISTNVTPGRSVVDFDTTSAIGVSTCSVDFTQVAVMTEQPMMTIALSATPSFAGTFRHATTGDQFKEGTDAKWLLTSAKLAYSEGNCTESWSAVLQGAPLITQPTAGVAPTKRTDLSDTAHGKTAITALAIGGAAASNMDFVDFYDSFDITVDISTVENHATLDRWTWPTQAERKITINASRIVEAPAVVEAITAGPPMSMTTPASHLAWNIHNANGGAVGVAIAFGSKTYTGTFWVTDSKWQHGGDGIQKETITLENLGAVTVA
jgi:hypothetical protein